MKNFFLILAFAIMWLESLAQDPYTFLTRVVLPGETDTVRAGEEILIAKWRLVSDRPIKLSNPTFSFDGPMSIKEWHIELPTFQGRYFDSTSRKMLFYGWCTSQSDITIMLKAKAKNNATTGQICVTFESWDIEDASLPGKKLPVRGLPHKSECFTVVGKTTTTLEKKSHHKKFSLYPNPTSDHLYGFEKDGQLEVYDMQGKLFLLNVTKKVLDTRDLPPGVYTIPRMGRFVKQ